MKNQAEIRPCCCSAQQAPPPKAKEVRKAAKAIPSMLLSVVVAFFPKCPVCWAVYMSMFGSLGLAQLPYMGWMLPVLAGLLGLHLYMLYRKVPQTGYLPFILSLAGALVILLGRSFFPYEKWLLLSGAALVMCGSLLNSFFHIRLQVFQYKQTN